MKKKKNEIIHLVVMFTGMLCTSQHSFCQNLTPFESKPIQNRDLVLAVPSFSSNRGFYDEPINVTMSCATPGAKIIYTKDGSRPSLTNGIQSMSNVPVTLLVETTIILRAVAVKDGFQASAIGTQTFLFPNQILRQNRPSDYPQSLDMEMDPEVTQVPDIARQIRESFSLIPTVSLVAPYEVIFGTKGIYMNPKEPGTDWECQASFEWIPSNKGVGKQADCGVRIQGASSREVSRKHGLRLSFKSQFGSKKFKGRLFKDTKVKSFDSLILRNPTHDSWAVSNPEWRENARYVNDLWAAETQRLMGHNSPSRRWVHLFLNGFYWGIYTLTERPDEHFAASHMGGEDKDYDVFNANRLRAGSRENHSHLLKLLAAPGVETPETYQEIKRLLDIDAFIDYVLYNLYANNIDWIHKNYWLVGERSQNARFRFVNWDAEILFWESWSGTRNRRNQSALNYDILTDNTLYSDTQGVGFFLVRLSKNAEFRRQFGDRAHFHTKRGGLLSPAGASTRYRRLLDEVEPLLDVESARWGDTYEKEPLSIDTLEWEHLTSEKSWLFSKFFPERTTRLIEQLRESNLYPKLDPPSLWLSVSEKDESFLFTAVNPNKNGEVIFSTNGIDPILLARSLKIEQIYKKPVLIMKGRRVMARVSLNGHWSALETLQIPLKK